MKKKKIVTTTLFVSWLVSMIVPKLDIAICDLKFQGHGIGKSLVAG
jgi:hypothetical protein